MQSRFADLFASCRRPILGAVVSCTALAGAYAVSEPPFASNTLRPFLETNCLDCHDDTTQKGDVRLDNLPLDFAKPETFTSWVKVLDQLDAGEMPPKKKKERPPADQAKAVTAWLRSGLHTASLAAQQTEGRAITRRLSRVEYQNTIRDLLDVDIDLSELLPEDPPTGSFDNSDAALNLSSSLLERYLEAAEMALDTAIVTGPRPETKTITCTFQKDGAPMKSVPWNAVAHRGDAVVFLNTAPFIQGFHTKVAGKYRIRLHGYGYQTKGLPMTFAVYSAQQWKALGDNLLGYFQAPPDNVGTVEMTLPVAKDLDIKIAPEGLTSKQLKDPDSYDGPGLAIQSIEVEGPLLPEWPPASHRRIFGDAPLEPLVKVQPERKKLGVSSARVTAVSTQPELDVERIINTFLPRAFRRVVSPEEAKPYLQIALERLKSGGTFEEAVRTGLKTVLCSPSFLLRTEKPGRLDDYALASRLSYFLWSSMPDDELFTLAAKHQLSQPANLHAQVERMLKSPKASAFTENFTGQWLGLRQIAATAPDKKLYPNFDLLLQFSMVEETESYFNELLTHDLSASYIVNSDFAMLNDRIARLYRVPGVVGIDFRKVPLPAGTHRGGFLTQASVLKITANGTNTSPVIRGNWVARNILNCIVPPPPKSTPAIEPDIRGAKTIREQIEKHRSQEACAGCHAKMDPAGFALENFDVIGEWRDTYRPAADAPKDATGHKIALKVDSAGQLPDGHTFTNIDELKQLLVANKEQVARSFATKLIVYATGHSLEFADRASVEAILQHTRAKDFGIRSIVHEVVQSPSFLNK